MLELTQFDTAKKEVTILTQKLEGFVITSPESREDLFNNALTANKIRNRIDSKRKELTEPYRTAKSNLIKQHKDEKGRLDEEIKKIDDYAKNDISQPLETAISVAKISIRHWDGEQAKIKADKEAKLEKERLEIEAKAKREEEEAKKQSGIIAKLALKKAEEKKVESLEIIRTEEVTLNTKKRGREVEIVSWEVTDFNVIPREFLIINVDKVAIKKAVDMGIIDIPGIKVSTRKELKFQ